MGSVWWGRVQDDRAQATARSGEFGASGYGNDQSAGDRRCSVADPTQSPCLKSKRIPHQKIRQAALFSGAIRIDAQLMFVQKIMLCGVNFSHTGIMLIV